MKVFGKLSSSAVILLAIITASAAAQTDEAGIRARLVGKPLYLRSQASSDKLEFDQQGKLIKPSPMTSFTLAGADVTAVKLNTTGLNLRVERVGLEFNKDVPKRLRIGGSLAMHIMRPADGDYTKALDAVFTDSIAEFDEPLPSYWAKFAQKHLLPAPLNGSQAAADIPEAAGLAKPPALPNLNVTPPVLIKWAEPPYPPLAHDMRFSGVVLVNMIITPDGTTAHFNILHAAGLGLDEAAIRAVSQYKFKPAMKDGRPVAVELNVDVNFQAF